MTFLSFYGIIQTIIDLLYINFTYEATRGERFRVSLLLVITECY